MRMMAGYNTGNTVQVIVKNIPEKWNHHKVKGFLELCCDAEGDDDVLPISYFNNVQTIAKSGFSNNVDLEQVILKAKVIKPQIVLLELSDPDGLILYNLPPDVTVGTICRTIMSVVDGVPGDTFTIKLYKEINIAVLLINNIEVVEKWLDVKLCGMVTVEPYCKTFHDVAISRLIKNKTSRDIVPQRPKITIIKQYHVDYDSDDGVEDSVSIDQFPETSTPNTSPTSVHETPRYNLPISKPRTRSSIITFHQASIIVKQGNITKEKADVLVNVLSPDMNLRHTAVSKSFIKTGGSSFVTNFETEKANQVFSSADTIIETDGTSLGCQRVCHVLLEKWKEPGSAHVLTAVINDVLSRAHGHQLRSVAFPSLGCGKLYGFPPDMMATTALKALQQSVNKYPSIKKITFVIYDKDVYEVFLSKMSPDKAGSPRTAMASPVTPDDETDDDSDSDEDLSSLTMKSVRDVKKSHKYYGRSQESGVPSKGTMEYLQHMTIKREPPSYWKKSKTWKVKVSNILPSSKPNLKESLKPTSSLYICIEDLVKKTWRADKVGHGKDAANLHHQNIKITNIERIENIELYHKYCDRRCELFGKAVKLQMSFINIDKIPGSSGPILTSKLAGPELKQDIYPEVNEHYVFHGSTAEKLEAICCNGLDHRTASNNGLFGSAVYTAESSTKADQYADDKMKRSPGPKKMILSRILLGRVYLCTDKRAPKFKKPPCTDLKHLDPFCTQGHEFFDSIMGDKSWLFREFAIYDDRSTYPEYVITYNRC